MSNINLLLEEVPIDLIETEIIEESNQGKKNYYITGPFLEADIKNRNRRIYPKPIIEREVKKFNEEKIKTNRALGELKHPESIEVDPERASHLIKELRMEKNIAYGKALVLDTPTGKIVKSLLDAGVKLGVSSRGTGTIRESIVQPDFRLITIDIVTDPSAPSAFVEGIYESTKEWVIKDGIIMEKQLEENVEKVLNKTNKKPEELALEAFKNFLNLLKESI